MRAGRLHSRVQLQRYTSTTDAAGQVSKTWTTVATVWAAVEPLSGRELFEAQQVVPRATHQITIRGRQTVTTDQRILLAGGRVVSIGSARNTDERIVETIITGIEVPAAQAGRGAA